MRIIVYNFNSIKCFNEITIFNNDLGVCFLDQKNVNDLKNI